MRACVWADRFAPIRALVRACARAYQSVSFRVNPCHSVSFHDAGPPPDVGSGWVAPEILTNMPLPPDLQVTPHTPLPPSHLLPVTRPPGHTPPSLAPAPPSHVPYHTSSHTRPPPPGFAMVAGGALPRESPHTPLPHVPCRTSPAARPLPHVPCRTSPAPRPFHTFPVTRPLSRVPCHTPG